MQTNLRMEQATIKSVDGKLCISGRFSVISAGDKEIATSAFNGDSYERKIQISPSTISRATELMIAVLGDIEEHMK